MNEKNSESEEVAILMPDGRRLTIDPKIVEKYGLKELRKTPFSGLKIKVIRGEGVNESTELKLKSWTEEEEKFLLENWGKLPKEELAKRFGVSINAVRKKYQRLTQSKDKDGKCGKDDDTPEDK
jgi:hypothetical protein